MASLKPRRAVLVAALTAAMTLATSPLAAAPASAAYYTACGNPTGISPTWHIVRNAAGLQYTHVRLQTVIRDLRPCTGNGGFSAVFVNLQDTDCTPFVQLGYGRLDDSSALQWLSTPADNSPECALVTARGGISFVPTIGNRVEFTIEKASSTSWGLQIRDITAGRSAYWTISDHGDYTNLIWYGIENHRLQDQFGGAGGANNVILDNLQYRYNGNANWVWVTGDTQAYWANVNPASIPSYWVESVSSAGPLNRTVLSGYTNNH